MCLLLHKAMGRGASFDEPRTPLTVWPNGGTKKMAKPCIHVVDRTFHVDNHSEDFQANRKITISPKNFTFPGLTRDFSCGGWTNPV